MRSWIRAALVAAFAMVQPLALFAQAGSGGKNRPEHVEKPYVIVVSFDGFRHDYVDRIETPNFHRVIHGGVRAGGLIPVFPSKTFPNHYSIATGMYAEKHGLVDNSFYDPIFKATYRLGDTLTVRDGRWYGGEPIWVTAEKQGMVSAAYFFVGTEAPIAGVLPSHYHKYDAAVTNEMRVAKSLEWLRLPAAERPHLIMLYFSAVDDAGHRYGPDSPEVEVAVKAVDGVLGQLLDGVEKLPIADQVNIVLVSDHGMAPVDTVKVEYLDDVVELDGVNVLGNGPYATLWVGDARRAEKIAATLRGRLRHAQVFLKGELPDRYRYRGSHRTGDVLVLAEPGHQVGLRSRRPGAGGAHGYDPASNLMQGIFFAMGPRIHSGVMIPPFENIHVYPLIAHLLGLQANPAIDGRLDVLSPILH